MMNDPNAIHFGQKTKKMTGFKGVRKTITSVPLSFCMQHLFVYIKYEEDIGAGYPFYNHEICPTKKTPSSNLEIEDKRKKWDKKDGKFKYKKFENKKGIPIPFILGLDDEGTTISIQITGVTYSMFVEFPEGWTSSTMKSMVNTMERSIGISQNLLEISFSQMDQLVGYIPDEKNLSERKKFWYAEIKFLDPTKLHYAHRWLTNPELNLAQLRKEGPFNVYEADIALEDKIYYSLDLHASQWITIKNWVLAHKYYTHSQVELRVDAKSIVHLPGKENYAPRWEVYWDTETRSDTGRFPDPRADGCNIICLCAIFYNTGTKQRYNICLYNGQVSDKDDSFDENTFIYCFDKEEDLIQRWGDLLSKDFQVCFHLGHNTLGFDNEYVALRAMKSQYVTSFNRSGWFIDEIKPLVYDTGLRGQYAIADVPLSGRMCIDTQKELTATKKLRSYKLSDVCELFFPNNPELWKLDMLPCELWENHNSGDLDKRKKIVIYCFRDCLCVFSLEMKFKFVLSHFELSRAIENPIEKIIKDGPQKKMATQVYRFCRTNGFIMNTSFIPELNRIYEADYVPSKGKRKDTQYEGAIVLDPQIGHYEDPVIVGDFTSMYPSIIIATLLCLCNAIVDLELVKVLKSKATPIHKFVPMNPDKDEELPLILWKGENFAFYEIRPKVGMSYYFMQNKRNVFPTIQSELKSKRIAVKAQMKKLANEGADCTVLDIRQNALKLAGNAMYGALGGKGGIMTFLGIAASVTTIGRKLIIYSKIIVEKESESFLCNVSESIRSKLRSALKVIYGDTDSIMVLADGVTTTEAFEIGKAMVAYIVLKLDHRDLIIALEKIIEKFMVEKKKTYCGLKITDPTKPGEIIGNGAPSSKRSTAAGESNLYNLCLNALIFQGSPEKALELLNDYINGIIYNLHPIEYYTVSQSVKAESEYKSVKSDGSKRGSYSSAYWLVKKYEQRKQQVPQPGSRVSFVKVVGSSQYANENVETVEYLKTHPKVRIDGLHYISRLKTSIGELLGPCFTGLERYFEYKKDMLNIYHNKQTAISPFCISPDIRMENDILSSKKENNFEKNDQLKIENSPALKKRKSDFEIDDQIKKPKIEENFNPSLVDSNISMPDLEDITEINLMESMTEEAQSPIIENEPKKKTYDTTMETRIKEIPSFVKKRDTSTYVSAKKVKIEEPSRLNSIFNWTQKSPDSPNFTTTLKEEKVVFERPKSTLLPKKKEIKPKVKAKAKPLPKEKAKPKAKTQPAKQNLITLWTMNSV